MAPTPKVPKTGESKEAKQKRIARLVRQNPGAAPRQPKQRKYGVTKLPSPRSRNNQLGGTGLDQDKGKERTEFEDRRRGGNSGGSDRPPVYKPNDDGERGGYVNRLSPSGSVGIGRGRTKPPISKNASNAAKQKLNM